MDKRGKEKNYVGDKRIMWDEAIKRKADGGGVGVMML